jgi:hypothetical protein
MNKIILIAVLLSLAIWPFSVSAQNRGDMSWVAINYNPRTQEPKPRIWQLDADPNRIGYVILIDERGFPMQIDLLSGGRFVETISCGRSRQSGYEITVVNVLNGRSATQDCRGNRYATNTAEVAKSMLNKLTPNQSNSVIIKSYLVELEGLLPQ